MDTSTYETQLSSQASSKAEIGLTLGASVGLGVREGGGLVFRFVPDVTRSSGGRGWCVHSEFFFHSTN
jgi:hypothetical protein